ncbi:hypothetical protein Lal_00008229 [Lupinus albus]|uniref:Uncharacterized protein n=1 Tax=Lupinus albus TaxID=3870 RepID=A0A6A4PP06_LUPAL|nr:hypothetical protein Lalb_Chr12g0208921 [Lupinus albus]KAF1868422.1 hypothetical protein Lal_00008229 [Lupinus albus]
MKTCKIMMLLFTIYILATLVSGHSVMAESVVEDVAAIPPTPMESAGLHHGVSAAFSVMAIVVAWFI